MAAESPFSPEEASSLDSPLQVAEVARDFAVFSFRLFEAATNGFLTPDVLGSDVGLKTDSRFVRIPVQYTQLQVRKWAWNNSLAGIGVSAQAMDRALDDTFGQKPSAAADSLSDLQAARVIVYMIRCAFAHNPFNPKWECYNQYLGVFSVRVLRLQLDTRTLNGQFLVMKHLGGLDGYWLLLQFCCEQIRGAVQP